MLDSNLKGFEFNPWSDLCVGYSASGLKPLSLPKIKLKKYDE
jgi:hypothetical protein